MFIEITPKSRKDKVFSTIWEFLKAMPVLLFQKIAIIFIIMHKERDISVGEKCNQNQNKCESQYFI